jgi:hypothetical protein
LTTIESVAQKGYFIGMLALLVEFKIHLFEKSDVAVSGGKLEKAYKHVELIKEISPLLYIEYILMRGLYNFTQKEPTVEIFKELVDVFRYIKIFRKFKKGLCLVNSFANMENCLKYLILLYSISFRVKVDDNMLNFLQITDENLLNITVNDSITIDSIIKCNFNYLNDLNIKGDMKYKIGLSNIQIPNIDDIFNVLYPKELGFRELTKADDILDLNSNTIFRNAYGLLK